LNTEIIKRPQADFDAHVLLYWLMFLPAPGKKTGPGEPVELGEIGIVPGKNWSKATPYNLAVKE